MKIKCVFQNGAGGGDVEVSKEIGNSVLDFRREEENLTRKERCHCYSLDAAELEGEDYADPDTPETVLFSRLEGKHIAETLDELSEVQRRRLQLLNRMIEECMAGHIDMIITKPISWFARNTLDCLKYIRELKDKNNPVFFEKENINTMDFKGEVLLTIMASLAQQESQSFSQNIKLGLQYRYQNGEVRVSHNRFHGYTKNQGGTWL